MMLDDQNDVAMMRLSRMISWFVDVYSEDHIEEHDNEWSFG